MGVERERLIAPTAPLIVFFLFLGVVTAAAVAGAGASGGLAWVGKVEGLAGGKGGHTDGAPVIIGYFTIISEFLSMIGYACVRLGGSRYRGLICLWVSVPALSLRLQTRLHAQLTMRLKSYVVAVSKFMLSLRHASQLRAA